MKNKILTIGIVLVTLSLLLVTLKVTRDGANIFSRSAYHQFTPNYEAITVAGDLVRIEVSPAFNFSFAFMEPGVIQHLDRQYTYDVIPPELLNGLLFQGIHQPQKGTTIKLTVSAPTKIYFFFHYQVDGGYSDIFARLNGWHLCPQAPQYDIYNGDHGLKMLMYEIDADSGTYTIPATTEERACFSIVFISGDRN